MNPKNDSKPDSRSVSEGRGRTPVPVARWSLTVRVMVSAILASHFAILAVNYASNNSLKRSEFEDSVLIPLQPYLIGMGWYTEFAPVALVTGEMHDDAMRIEYQTSKSDLRWTTWIDSRNSDGRWRRLVALAGALAFNDDSDGMGLIAHTLVSKASREGIAMERIRFAISDPEQGGEPEAIYEASVVALGPDEITLVPQIEETRSVPVVPVAKGAVSR